MTDASGFGRSYYDIIIDMPHCHKRSDNYAGRNTFLIAISCSFCVTLACPSAELSAILVKGSLLFHVPASVVGKMMLVSRTRLLVLAFVLA